jgi:KDO2-lipid IV(A) lauroyltransferase
MFGRPMPLPAGVIALARAAGAPILPVFVLREGRCRYRVIFRPPIEVPEHAGRDEAVAAAAQRIAAGLEEAIRRAPEQWFCFRALWPPDRAQTR